MERFFNRWISSLFILLYFFCSCEKISALEDDMANLKERLLLQEMLMQSIIGESITCTSILQGNEDYIIQFSNGASLKIHGSVIPLVYIGDNGHWFIYGNDTGRNAFENQPSIPTVEIIQGYWYIDGVNTGVKAVGQDGNNGNNGKDGKDAPFINNIVEYADYWSFYFSDGSVIDVKKTPVSYNIENEVVSRYLKEVSYDNSDYSYTMVSSYRSIQTDYRKDLPSPIKVQWTNRSYNGQNQVLIKKEIVVTDNNSFRLSKDLSTSDNSFYINNLVPNTEYCVKVTDCFSDGSKQVILSKKLVVEGQLRMLEIDGEGTWNFRDLGGWKTTTGRIIKYGRLIRGGEVLRGDEKAIEISQSGIHQLIDLLGIDVELDFGDFSNASPLVDYGVLFIHGSSYQITAYEKGLQDAAGRQRYGNCLLAVIKYLTEGRNILFHCNAGADRTGTFAFIIEGLLGCSESDIAKEYELTSFSQYAQKRRNSNEYCPLISFVKQNYPGNTINEKIEAMTTLPVEQGGLGLKQEDIILLRELLLVN